MAERDHGLEGQRLSHSRIPQHVEILGYSPGTPTRKRHIPPHPAQPRRASAAAAIHSRACCMRAPGKPTPCGTSATSKGVRGAGRASSTAAGSSPRDGRRAMGPMSLLRTTAATHRLSSADRRLPGLGTRRRVPTTGLRERGNDTSRSTGRSGRQNAATRRNMCREERVTVQGPVKKQRPDGMSHGGCGRRGEERPEEGLGGCSGPME